MVSCLSCLNGRQMWNGCESCGRSVTDRSEWLGNLLVKQKPANSNRKMHGELFPGSNINPESVKQSLLLFASNLHEPHGIAIGNLW